MVHLSNISRKGNKVSCNYSPENSGQVGFVEVDINTAEYLRKEKTDYDAENERYVGKVRMRLLDLAEKETMPETSKVVWY